MSQQKGNKPSKKKFGWLKWLLFIPIIGLAVYFGKDYLPKKLSVLPIFTEYGELSKDTIALQIIDDTVDSTPENTLPPMDSAIVETDSLLITDTLSVEEEINPEIYEVEPNPIEETKEITPPNDKKNLSPKQGLFDDFSFEDNQVDTLDPEYQQFFNQQMLSSKTVIRILAITGKDILINGISNDTKDIFANIVAEDNITGVLLCDKKGKVKYATNTKFENDHIQQIFPDFDISNPSLGWGGNELQMVITTPIYDTFGKIGTIILVARKDKKQE